ncbi:MAG: hypothetical protein V4710_15535 [Verrucomicrobiota bacterium]
MKLGDRDTPDKSSERTLLVYKWQYGEPLELFVPGDLDVPRNGLFARRRHWKRKRRWSWRGGGDDNILAGLNNQIAEGDRAAAEERCQASVTEEGIRREIAMGAADRSVASSEATALADLDQFAATFESLRAALGELKALILPKADLEFDCAICVRGGQEWSGGQFAADRR